LLNVNKAGLKTLFAVLTSHTQSRILMHSIHASSNCSEPPLTRMRKQ
jgi:hypothetical protein